MSVSSWWYLSYKNFTSKKKRRQSSYLDHSYSIHSSLSGQGRDSIYVVTTNRKPYTKNPTVMCDFIQRSSIWTLKSTTNKSSWTNICFSWALSPVGLCFAEACVICSIYIEASTSSYWRMNPVAPSNVPTNYFLWYTILY